MRGGLRAREQIRRWFFLGTRHVIDLRAGSQTACQWDRREHHRVGIAHRHRSDRKFVTPTSAASRVDRPAASWGYPRTVSAAAFAHVRLPCAFQLERVVTTGLVPTLRWRRCAGRKFWRRNGRVAAHLRLMPSEPKCAFGVASSSDRQMSTGHRAVPKCRSESRRAGAEVALQRSRGVDVDVVVADAVHLRPSTSDAIL